MDILNNLTIHLSNETSIDAKELETIKIKLTQLNESLTSFFKFTSSNAMVIYIYCIFILHN
jgi:hypothetical protein